MTKRILIVEDERHIGVGIKYNCEAEGFTAVLVGDGPSALRLFEADPDAFDLLILDLMLPDMSGYAVLEKLRKNSIHVPVLILSARTLSEDRTRGFDLGADQYMMKPFELTELLSRVRNLLNRQPSVRLENIRVEESVRVEKEDVYEFNGARINFTRHEALVRGEPKSLTALEFDLLKCFFNNEGIVLTRNQLLDRVWGNASSPSTRTVDNFIVRLRKYFEDDPSRPRHFLSIRGVGYRFVREPAAAPESVSDEETSEETV
jgi:two-component system OmpR family response regulator